MLSVNELAARLESDWLGRFPESPIESANLFSAAVATWFASATAGPAACTTAAARRPQLFIAAATALRAGTAPSAGALLAGAVAGYYAGQAFAPAGIASIPIAIAPAAAAFVAAFLDFDLTTRGRAERIAQACHLMALSTLVVFPNTSIPVT